MQNEKTWDPRTLNGNPSKPNEIKEVMGLRKDLTKQGNTVYSIR